MAPALAMLDTDMIAANQPIYAVHGRQSAASHGTPARSAILDRHLSRYGTKSH